MKQVLCIMTHPDSDWEKLVKVLEEHPSIQCFPTDHGYHHPDDLKVLTDHIHKKNNSAAVWATVVLYNKDFTCRALSKSCKFIYWAGDSTDYRMDGLKLWHKRTGGLWNPSLSEKESLFSSIFG